MTPADSYTMLWSMIVLIACPLAYLAGALCGGRREMVSKCCACGARCYGVKCNECADFKPENL